MVHILDDFYFWRRIRLAKSQEVARPEPAASDARETRENAGLREFTEYMKEAAPNDDDPTFTVLEYWKPRVTDGLNMSGNVVLPARWPHVGLVARLYAGVDATSCQAERNFFGLKLTASDLRANMSPAKVEKTLFLRLNRHFIPRLGPILRGLDALGDERKSNTEAAVAAKNAAAGPTVVSLVV